MSTNELDKTNFEHQRDALIQEIILSFDQVLTNLNHLNRSLEGVSAIGREFESVRNLWSVFDDVMAQRQPGEAGKDETRGRAQGPEDIEMT